MKSIFTAVLTIFFITGDALAQTDTPSPPCDKMLDITDTTSKPAPLTLNANESLCLDSRQIATWFVDQGGWTSVLAQDGRYWQLTPPGPTRAIFTLHLPSGDQRKLRVAVNPAESADDESLQD